MVLGRLMLPAAMALASATLADVTLPNIFSDHMVLQQKTPIPVWGKAEPGESVAVSFAGQQAQTMADIAGNWMVRLKPINAKSKQAGQTLTVTGKNTVEFTDVLVGEVWLCSGQSNMEMAVSATKNAQQEIATANKPLIRLFAVPNVTAIEPQENCGGQWMVCTPDTVAGFSAVGYYFGRYLQDNLKVPIGLIDSSWGGTIAEAWTSETALRAKFTDFNAALDAMKQPSAKELQAIADYPSLVAKRQQERTKMNALENDPEPAKLYAPAELDDSQWKTMSLPGNWEERGLKDFDGIVWFRKTIDVPASWAGKDIILRPGPIDEVDYCWFNGETVGGKGNFTKGDTSFWNVPREYRVPGRLVKAGPNVIALRVFDAAGQGGLWGAGADTMYAEIADKSDQTHLSLAGDWRYFVEFTLMNTPPNPNNPNIPSKLYNGMIAPLIPYAIRGAIWYQGESNAGRAEQYQTLLPTMITDWRTRFGVGDFPFLIVSLANFQARTNDPVQRGSWAELREAQAMIAATLPNTGLAMAIDIGEEKDIHPKNKQEVGRRLGLAARAIAYKQKLVYSGPVFEKMTVKNGKAELTFKYTNGGLKAQGDTLKGFAICGPDGKFVWAQAKIDGKKVVVWADGIAQPTAVRYAWANNPECNLYNGAGLPAVPFRTDR